MFIHEEVKASFGKREQNGWKARPNELITHSNCARLQKLYELVYGHVPTNSDYPAIFLHGWLVQCKNHEVNSAQYAYYTIQEQMRLTKRPGSSSNKSSSGRFSLQKTKIEK
jgi:hypothetical protein